MRRSWKSLCIVLCIAMVLSLTACGSSNNGYYRIINTYSAEGSYVIAFRQGDKICQFVTAAMKELARNGTFRTASVQWFGEDLVGMRGEEGAMDDLWDDVTERTITVGVDITNMPMSYEEDGTYKGFDVDIANYICGYLGWSMVVYPIDMADVDVELNSGNIDMAMGISMSDESSSFSYSPAYLTSRYVLVALSASWIRNKSAMKGKMLGMVISDLDILRQDEKFVAKLGGITYQTNTEGLFQALLKGDVDCILVSSVVAAYYMK